PGGGAGPRRPGGARSRLPHGAGTSRPREGRAVRALLLVHAVLGFTAVFAATHLAVYALLAARRGAGSGLRRFSWIAPAAALPQFALGLILYPAYRLRVRLPDLDKNAPRVAQ